MWNNSKSNAKSPPPGKRRERLRRVIHIKRINAQLEYLNVSPESTPKTNVRLVLNDLSTKGIGLYSSTPLNIDQLVILHITDPLTLKIHARVAWCQDNAATSHILSNEPYGYRVGLEFAPDDREAEDLKHFCDEVFHNILFANK